MTTVTINIPADDPGLRWLGVHLRNLCAIHRAAHPHERLTIRLVWAEGGVGWGIERSVNDGIRDRTVEPDLHTAIRGLYASYLGPQQQRLLEAQSIVDMILKGSRGAELCPLVGQP